jgi:hypothetical protein
MLLYCMAALVWCCLLGDLNKLTEAQAGLDSKPEQCLVC